MGLMSTIRQWLKRGATAAKSDAFATSGFTRSYAETHKYDIPNPAIYGAQADLYRTISWIASAIKIKASTAATAKFSVAEIAGEDRNDLPNHEFEKRLDHPNPLMSRLEFIEAICSYYTLTGNAYIWLNRASENAPIDEMWVIPSNEIEPIPDERMFVSGYRYQYDNSSSIPVWQIVHLKTFNPNNLFVGLSPIESIAYQAHADLGRSKTDSQLYNENNGQAPSILAFADKFQPAEWAEINKQLSDAAKAAKRFMTMDNAKAGGVQWIQSQMSNVDMQFLEMRTFTKEEIYNIFAPGLASVLSVNATEANAVTGKATFIEFAVWPFLEALAQKFSNEILPIYGDNLDGAFDDIRVKNKVIEFQEITLYSLTHTLAEVRQKYWKDDPLGDERDNLLPSQAASWTPPAEDEPEPIVTMPVTPPGQPAQAEVVPPVEDDEDGEPDDAALMAAEMKRYRRVARKAVEAGKPVKQFESEIIPLAELSEMRSELTACKTVEDVDRVFIAHANPQKTQAESALVIELRMARELLERELALPIPEMFGGSQDAD